ncbi:hypothetical protein RhiirA4_461404 [Rhizophagus irregularis]|uniref:Uncharacterized protein n=1 Tax=Rhizophagus irregularis TaxID=588596 RepID=A0A2I1GIQ9_9GLOM|nr:hypothetical protein RhiirA4_461404 [Rhizophagus irregularis]
MLVADCMVYMVVAVIIVRENGDEIGGNCREGKGNGDEIGGNCREGKGNCDEGYNCREGGDDPS